jgi:predicted nucleic acid-binding protein
MVNVYAESSAVLPWLLGEETGRSVREVLQHTELVMTSDLTLVECDRVLIRAVTTGEIDEAAAADRRAHLNAAASHWQLWRVSPSIVERATVRFLPNPFGHLRRFTWHRHWPFVRPPQGRASDS